MNSKRYGLLGGLTVLLLVAICSYLFWPREEVQPIQQPEPELADGDPKAEEEPEAKLIDTDGDGLDDAYELVFFHSLDESGDEDKDGLPDKLELRYFDSLEVSADIDQDGLPDAWEMQHFKTLDWGPDDNPDQDDFSNIQELQRGRAFRPDRKTTVKKWDDTKATVTVSGASSIAGEGKRGPDGKIYFRKTYQRLYKEGKFDVPWEDL